MAKVILRQEAIDDLNYIWNYTVKNGRKFKLTNIMQQSSLPVKQLQKTQI